MIVALIGKSTESPDILLSTHGPPATIQLRTLCLTPAEKSGRLWNVAQREIPKMLKTMLLAIASFVIWAVPTSNNFSLAQMGSETDPRFEKLAKDLYPKAKQEGALV